MCGIKPTLYQENQSVILVDNKLTEMIVDNFLLCIFTFSSSYILLRRPSNPS